MPATENEQRYCPNCHYPLPGYGTFCTHCGQKYTTGKVKLSQLFSDLFDSIFNLDNRVFRSLGALLLPGQLTRAYFSGHQRRYLRPIRLFLVAAVIHFSALSFLIGDVLEKQMTDTIDQQKREVFHRDMMQQLDAEADTILQQYDYQPPLPAAMDSLIASLQYDRSDTLFAFYITWPSLDSGFQARSLQIDMPDAYNLPPDSLFAKYDVQGRVAQLQVQQFLKVNQRGGGFVRQAIGQQLWTYLLLIPLIALWLKLLYIRRRHYYVEHLVFNLHVHTFAFLFAALIYLLYMWLDSDSFWILLVGMLFFYIYFAFYRYYRQGWFKTLVKFSLYGFVYVLLYSVLLLFTILLSALTF